MEAIFDHELRKDGGKFLFDCNFHKADIKISNSFIEDVCNAWTDFIFCPPANNYGNQFILNNFYVKIDHNVVYSEMLRRKNAYCVRSFFDENGNLLSYLSFIEKFQYNR